MANSFKFINLNFFFAGKSFFGTNGYGWKIHAFIEDYNGELRPQSFEERMFCMGCHSAVGTTIDHTFSLARKVTGAKGWGYINLKGMKDAPSISESGGEILNYLKRVSGGNEFRANQEIQQKWFNADGTLKLDEIASSDVYQLITPSKQRALKLNKAYTHIVRHQSYIYGRDPNIKPLQNVHKHVDESQTPLSIDARVSGWDIRLDWDATTHANKETSQHNVSKTKERLSRSRQTILANQPEPYSRVSQN